MISTTYQQESEKLAFAKRAADAFAKNPEMTAYADNGFNPGCLISLRCDNDSADMFVMKLDASAPIVNYQNIVRTSERMKDCANTQEVYANNILESVGANGRIPVTPTSENKEHILPGLKDGNTVTTSQSFSEINASDEAPEGVYQSPAAKMFSEMYAAEIEHGRQILEGMTRKCCDNSKCLGCTPHPSELIRTAGKIQTSDHELHDIPKSEWELLGKTNPATTGNRNSFNAASLLGSVRETIKEEVKKLDDAREAVPEGATHKKDGKFYKCNGKYICVFMPIVGWIISMDCVTLTGEKREEFIRSLTLINKE